MKSDLSSLVDLPTKGSYNTDLSACKPSTLTKVFGRPREQFTSKCQPVTNKSYARRIVTASVGPFRVTGLDIAVASLTRVMDQVRLHDPEAYASVGTAGMLCCRLVRGSKTAISNHSWGTAIDLTFDGVLDRPNNGRCQLGLLRVYRHFHEEGWYWGAGFSREDAMHFELADETIRKLTLQSSD